MISKPVKILLADDDADIRKLLQMRLQTWGFDVSLASDGLEARDVVKSCDPDVVISDVLMPGLTGLDLLRSLKVGNPDRPILLITAHPSVEVAVKAMKEGAQDVLTKPLDDGKLKASLDSILRDLKSKQGGETRPFGDFAPREQTDDQYLKPVVSKERERQSRNRRSC
jgi:DNA-binding NtrC family response regulator